MSREKAAMEAKLAAVRGAIRMIINAHTPGGITFTDLHTQLTCSHLEVSNDMLVQALRLEHEEGGVNPTPHGWVLGAASTLDWGKPPSISSPGERYPYESTMPDAWKGRWKAKLLGQRSSRYERLRVEIRKTVAATGYGAVQVLIVVLRDGTVRMSANGAAAYTGREFAELQLAVAEAREAMRAYERARPLPEEEAA